MFTGIVRDRTIVSADDHGGGRALVVRAPGVAASTSVGDSVSINGCCLTAESVDGEQVSFRAVSETLARTTLGQVGPRTSSTSSPQ